MVILNGDIILGIFGYCDLYSLINFKNTSKYLLNLFELQKKNNQ